MNIIVAVGATSLGTFIGWLVMYFVRRFKNYNPVILGALIAALLGGNGALVFLDENNESIWLYSIGLLGGGVIHTIAALKSGIPAKEIFTAVTLPPQKTFDDNNQTLLVPDEVKELQDQYPSQKVREYMEEQARLFEENREKLLEKYLGKYVLFENGKVIDFDKDKLTLVKKAYKNGGSRPLFIKKVVKEAPKPVVWVPVPFA